jgi:hypothetical protein
MINVYPVPLMCVRAYYALVLCIILQCVLPYFYARRHKHIWTIKPVTYNLGRAYDIR